jgi:hypothetical protein
MEFIEVEMILSLAAKGDEGFLVSMKSFKSALHMRNGVFGVHRQRCVLHKIHHGSGCANNSWVGPIHDSNKDLLHVFVLGTVGLRETRDCGKMSNTGVVRHCGIAGIKIADAYDLLAPLEEMVFEHPTMNFVRRPGCDLGYTLEV